MAVKDAEDDDILDDKTEEDDKVAKTTKKKKEEKAGEVKEHKFKKQKVKYMTYLNLENTNKYLAGAVPGLFSSHFASTQRFWQASKPFGSHCATDDTFMSQIAVRIAIGSLAHG